jgi:trigger factor
LTDALVKEDGEFESVEALRQGLAEQLQEQAEQQAKSDLMDEFVDDLLADAQINYPPAAVESEIQDTVENFKNQVTRSGWKWEDYLQLQGETEASLGEQVRDDAEERVRRGLVLRQLIREEKLKVDPDDIDASVEKRLDSFGEDEELRERLRSFFSQGQGLESMSNEILLEKTQERIEAIVTGIAPDLAALEEVVADDEPDILEEE